MRAGQAECFTQKIDQQLPGFHFSLVNLPIDSDSYLNALRSDRHIHAIPQPVRHDFEAAKLLDLFSPHEYKKVLVKHVVKKGLEVSLLRSRGAQIRPTYS